jgi:hypothetical protein
MKISFCARRFFLFFIYQSPKPLAMRFPFYRALITLLFVFFVHDSNAQKKADTSFRLLWFKGKKINDSTLMKLTGEKLSYSPSQGRVSVAYPAGRDPVAGLRNEIGRNEASKTQIDRKIAGAAGSPRPPGMVVAANRGFDQAAGDVQALIENSFSLYEPAVENFAQVQLAIKMSELPQVVHEYYNEVMDYVHHPDPDSAFTPVPPPSFQFDYCYPCDAGRKETYRRDSAAFINSFLKKESLNRGKAGNVLAYFQRLKPKPGPDSLFAMKMRNDMYEALTIISERIEKKLIHVWNTYKGDPAKVPFLVGLLMKMSHTRDLMGLKKTPGFPDIGILSLRLLAVTLDVLRKAKTERDYTVLLNVRGIMYLFKYAQLLGLAPEEFEQGIDEYMKMNQFQVTVDAEAKIEAEELTEMAKLHFEGPFDAFPDPSDSTCELKWYPHGMDSAKGIVYKLEAEELRGQDHVGTYVGTREFGSKRPWLKLDFCREDRDSALFYPFFPYHGQDIWDMDQFKDYPFQVVSTVFMSGFMDPEALKKRQAELGGPGALAGVQQQMTNVYKQKVAPNMEGMNMNPATMTPKDYEKAAELMDAADEMTHITWNTALYNFPVKGRLQNKQKIVFDETLDGKSVSLFANIAFATFRVRIEHIE